MQPGQLLKNKKWVVQTVQPVQTTTGIGIFSIDPTRPRSSRPSRTGGLLDRWKNRPRKSSQHRFKDSKGFIFLCPGYVIPVGLAVCFHQRVKHKPWGIPGAVLNCGERHRSPHSRPPPSKSIQDRFKKLMRKRVCSRNSRRGQRHESFRVILLIFGTRSRRTRQKVIHYDSFC
jgi:hypothetical protein